MKKLKCTPKALAHIQKYLASHPTVSTLRIRLKKAGCSGWLYQFEYGNEPRADEIVCSADEDLKILIEQKHVNFFEGVIIDYVSSGFSAMLTCINPNEGIRCGCGESFTVGESL